MKHSKACFKKFILKWIWDNRIFTLTNWKYYTGYPTINEKWNDKIADWDNKGPDLEKRTSRRQQGQCNAEVKRHRMQQISKFYLKTTQS